MGSRGTGSTNQNDFDESPKRESFEDLISNPSDNFPLYNLPPPEYFSKSNFSEILEPGIESIGNERDTAYNLNENLPGLEGEGFFGLPGIFDLLGGVSAPPSGFGSAMFYETEELRSILELHNEVLDIESGSYAEGSFVDQPDAISTTEKLTAQPLNKTFQCYVEGMLFETTKSQLSALFDQASPLSIVVPIFPGTNLNKGIAYLSFATEEDLQRVLSMNQTQLDGRWLNIAPFDTPLDQITVIKLKNLSRHITDKKLHSIFIKFGAVEKVVLPKLTRKQILKKRTGVGYIFFKDPVSAQKALEMDGEKISGRKVDIVLFVKPLSQPDGTDALKKNQGKLVGGWSGS